jgi:hypothetical protein
MPQNRRAMIALVSFGGDRTFLWMLRKNEINVIITTVPKRLH